MVTWSRQARRDLRRIFDYIAQDSTHYARKVTQEIAGKTGILEEVPRIGKPTPEARDARVRELSVYTYRIIYEVNDDDGVRILTVVHKRRAMQPDSI